MASKYPSVTVATKAKAAPAPPKTVKGGKPLNKGQFNPQMFGKIPLGKAPRLKVGRGWIGLLPDAVKALQEIESAIDAKVWGIGGARAPSLVPNALNPAYWTVTCRCAGGTVGGSQCMSSERYTTNSTFGTCTAWQSSTNGPAAVGATTSTTPIFGFVTETAGSLGITTVPPSTNMWVRTTQAARKVGAPVPTPTTMFVSAPAPMTVPLAWPQAWPMAEPLVMPDLAPWTKPGPGDQPSEDAEPEPKPAFAPDANPVVLPQVPFPIVRFTPRPGMHPVVFPGITVKPAPSPGPGAPDPSPGVVAQPSPDFGKPAPPPSPGGPWGGGNSGKKTIEKKAKVSMAVGLVWAGLNTVTEAMDFVVAMHKSLPKQRQLSKKASKAQVIEYMMSHPDVWRHIEFAEGLQNFINMQISDMAAALGSQAIKKTNQDIGSLTGLDRALRAHSDNLAELDPDSDDNWTDLIPELDIDADDGSISIVGPLGVLRLKLKRK